MKYLDLHPEEITIDRTGKKQYMVWEYGYPGARAAKVAEFVYMVQHFGLTQVVPDMRTEAAQLPDQYYLPDKADQFGFNQLVVNDMQSLYGVNILTDSRFDITSPSFSPTDPMVENWHNLRGGYLTQLFRDIRTAMNAINPNFKITYRIPGDRVGSELGNWKLDWRTWVTEGLVDTLVVPVSLAAGIYYDPTGRGYISGTLPLSTYRSYINASSHPNVRLIQSGGSEYFPAALPSGADGFQTFWTCEAYDVSWYQRWEQWKQDINDFGYVRFFEQNFEDFSLNTIKQIGAEGDACYRPELQACPGGWYFLGDGNDTKATVQEAVKRGGTGKALKITKDSVWARHLSYFDKTYFQNVLDTAVCSGNCSLEFWVHRPGTTSSVMAYFQFDFVTAEYDVGVKIGDGSDGPLYYSNNGQWVETGYSVPTGIWQKITLEINLENKTYSAYMGVNKETKLCDNIAYTTTRNAFNMLYFQTSGATGNVIYIDDVSVQWHPNLHFRDKLENAYLTDSFETHTVGQSIHNVRAEEGINWVVVPSSSSAGFYIEKDLSYGDGFKCLAATRDASRAVLRYGYDFKLPLDLDQMVTVDFDVLFRDPASYSTIVALKKDTSSSPTAAIKATGGKWYYWNGSTYANSGVSLLDYGYCKLWNHVQIILHCKYKTYTVVVQPVGSMPTVLGTFPWDPGTQPDDEIFLEIAPQGSNGQKIYFDNVTITYGQSPPDACGDENHPYPASDLSHDCQVNFDDFAAFARHWLENTVVPSQSQNYVFFDDFENQPLGPLGTWVPIGMQWYDAWPNDSAHVVNTIAQTGSKSLQLTRAYPNPGKFPAIDGLATASSAYNGAVLTYTWNFYRPTATDGPEVYVSGAGGSMAGWMVGTVEGTNTYWITDYMDYDDTGVAAQVGAWVKVELVEHLATVGGLLGGTYDLSVTQGGVRTQLCTGNQLKPVTSDGIARLRLYCKPQMNSNVPNIVYWDNVYVQSLVVGPSPVCGDAEHPYPIGDFDKNCRADFADLASLLAQWLN